ncbi:hypothetical protein SDC9_162410 [bioreactor metagenome]|uniref:Uncharacterized protein n=1 Tax=bioreactor metagenome TaxID=1076179 RepID=A0A645FL10_9ZZZZ
MWVSVDLRPQNTHFVEIKHGFLLCLTPIVRQFMKHYRLSHYFLDGMPWVQGRVRVLKDHLHLFPVWSQLLFSQSGNICSIVNNIAFIRLVKSYYRSCGGRFTTA